MPGLAMKLAGRCMSLMIVWVPEAAYTRGAQDFWSGASVGMFRFVCADDTRVVEVGKPWRTDWTAYAELCSGCLNVDRPDEQVVNECRGEPSPFDRNPPQKFTNISGKSHRNRPC